MPVLREVITRYKFEEDREGAQRLERRLLGFRRNIAGLARLFGVGLGIAGTRAFLSIGQRAAQAEFNLRRFAGQDFSALRNQFQGIQQDLENIRAGTSSIVTRREFDEAAAGFLRVFGRGQRQVRAFGEIFEFAAKQSAITGEHVVGIVDSITRGLETGDFSAFLEFPGFDQRVLRQLEFVQGVIDPQEPGGQIALQQRLRTLTRIFSEFGAEQDRALRQLPANLLEGRRSAKTLQETFENLAKTLQETLVPLLERLNVLLAVFERSSTRGGLQAMLAGPAEQLRRSRVGQVLETLQRPSEFTAEDERLIERLRREGTQPGEAVRREIAGEARLRGLSPGVTINVENNFNINGMSDPEAVGREVERRMSGAIREAAQGLVPAEE